MSEASPLRPATGRVRAIRMGVLIVVVGLMSLAARDVPGAWSRVQGDEPELAAVVNPVRLPGADAAVPSGMTPIHWLRAAAWSSAVLDRPWPIEGPEDPAAERTRWDADRSIQLPGFAAWPLPDRPSWRENPYDDPTWVFEYQSLGWLATVAAEDPSRGVAADWSEVADLLVSWIRASGAPTDLGVGPWYDHAVALRTDAIVWLWANGLAEHVQDWQFREIVTSLAQHGRVLRALLDDPAWRGHNHNLFHAIALYDLARALPWLADADEWLSRARQRMHELLAEMVDVDEGVSHEQSFGYHFVALDLFWRAHRWLTDVGDPPPPEDRDTVRAMAAFASSIVDPLGVLPAVGDTAYDAEPDMRSLEDPALSSAWSAYLLSGGAAGTPPPGAQFFPRAGYAIFRSPGPPSGPDDAGHPELATQVVVDAGPSVRLHGHQDALNVIFTAGGQHILIDPGGPYIYKYPERQEFLASRAHNGMVVDGRSYSDADGPGDVTWTQADDSAVASVLTAWHQKDPAAQVVRTVILIRPDVLVVLDRLLPLDDDVHVYSASFQLAPGVRPTGGVYRSAGGGTFGVSFAHDPASALAVDPAAGGRVTTGPAAAQPAPIMAVRLTGGSAWLLTAISPGEPPTVTSEESPREARVRVTGHGADVVISFGRDESPVGVAVAGQAIGEWPMAQGGASLP